MINPLLREVKRVFLFKDQSLNRAEAIKILKPFFDLVLSCKSASIPILRELVFLGTGTRPDTSESGPLKKRINRRYLRLCRIVNELGRLDFEKAKTGVTPEDFIFSGIDFSRYREMDENDFDTIFPDGLGDFDDAMFRKNFGAEKTEIQSLIEKSYKKADGKCRLERENPLILSIMRALDISLEDLPLFTPEEIFNEQKKLPGPARKPGMETIFPLLVTSLDSAIISHGDGMITKLFITAKGDLSGIFQPEGKPWTRVLIPASLEKYC